MSQTKSSVRESTFRRARRTLSDQAQQVAIYNGVVDVMDFDLLFQKPSSKVVGGPQMQTNASRRITYQVKRTRKRGKVRTK
jgi:hypothetical protein